MDARGYYRSRVLYAVGAVAAPVLVAGLAALFLSMAAANRRYRKAAEDRDLLARLGEAAHTLAHEIRNPLGAIRMQTGLLRKGAAPSPAAHLDIIDQEVARLTVLSRRVGDFLKNPRGSPERIPLDAFLRELLPRFPWAVRLEPCADSAQVLFDRDLLRSVVENLVRNAHESYGDEAAQDGRDVAVAAVARPDGIRLSVLDRGKGLSSQRSEEVFGPFVTDKAGGSGHRPVDITQVRGSSGGDDPAAAPGRRWNRGAGHAAAGAGGGRNRVRVLVADDEKNIRDSVAAYIAAEGIETATAADGAAARALLESEAFDGLVLDLRMPRMDGLAVLAWLQESGPRVPVIVISAYGDVQDAVQAMKLGARDYLVKPFDPEELMLRLRRLLAEQAMVSRAEAGRRAAAVGLAGAAGTAAGPAGAPAAPWIGAGEKMAAVRSLVEKVAPTPSTVLVTGESGTGKEVIARLIHSLSANPEGPFAAVNIGGIPDTLLESELFGFEKGAFTGAVDRKRGLLELASGGTLFLDEIGDMPPQMQVKLLRVLQDRRIQRLGGTQPIPLNARIIAATNRPLETAIREGRFREDLYYRLNVIRVELPPLRERREDIPALAGFFVEKLNREMGRKVQGLDPDALARLCAYAFPGNIRELENRIERAYILCSPPLITARDLGEPFTAAARPPKRGALKDQERTLIDQVLARHGGNRTRAAAELGISRRTLQNKLKGSGQGGVRARRLPGPA